jgi:hypothetical protein
MLLKVSLSHLSVVLDNYDRREPMTNSIVRNRHHYRFLNGRMAV